MYQEINTLVLTQHTMFCSPDLLQSNLSPTPVGAVHHPLSVCVVDETISKNPKDFLGAQPLAVRENTTNHSPLKITYVQYVQYDQPRLVRG